MRADVFFYYGFKKIFGHSCLMLGVESKQKQNGTKYEFENAFISYLSLWRKTKEELFQNINMMKVPEYVTQKEFVIFVLCEIQCKDVVANDIGFPLGHTI